MVGIGMSVSGPREPFEAYFGVPVTPTTAAGSPARAARASCRCRASWPTGPRRHVRAARRDGRGATGSRAHVVRDDPSHGVASGPRITASRRAVKGRRLVASARQAGYGRMVPVDLPDRLVRVGEGVFFPRAPRREAVDRRGVAVRRSATRSGSHAPTRRAADRAGRVVRAVPRARPDRGLARALAVARPTSPRDCVNARVARPDLRPGRSRFYGPRPGRPAVPASERDDPAKFLLGPDGGDVPRNQQGVALIGDPRNDVHLFAQPCTSRCCTRTTASSTCCATGVAEADVFDEARRHAHLALPVDRGPRLPAPAGRRELVEQVLAEGGRWFAPPPQQAYIPLEFADAAFRYGHGQIRHTYRLGRAAAAVPLFPDLVGFGPCPPTGADRLDAALRPARPPAARSAPNAIDGRLAASLDRPARAGHRRGRRPPPTARWRSATCCAARPPGCPAARPSPRRSASSR